MKDVIHNEQSSYVSEHSAMYNEGLADSANNRPFNPRNYTPFSEAYEDYERGYNSMYRVDF